MTARSLKIFEVRIPLERIRALSPTQRYAYYLLGHIYNEMMSLQKIIGFAIPKHDDIRPARRNAEIAQALFLFRMAASKIYEAKAAINRREVHDTLSELVFAHKPELRESLRSLNKAVGSAEWLSRMRNGMGFHYPKFSDWEPYTTPDENWVDDIVYAGEQSGNTFFDSSATIAMQWMFDEYREYEATESVDLLIAEIIQLIKQINAFSNQMSAEIVVRMLPDEGTTLKAKVVAPEHEKVSLPYWTYLKSKPKQ